MPRAIRRAQTRPSRSLLYHYTTAEGFLGIVETGSVWATDIRFLNDTAEFTFARDALVRELLRGTRRLRNGRVRAIVQRELDSFASRTVPAYVVSFSERGNSLSQWRAYAPRDGVSIGFHRAALGAVKDFALWKCHYTQESEVAGRNTSRGLQLLALEVEQSIRWAARLIQAERRKKVRSAQQRSIAEAKHALIISTPLAWAALKLKHSGFAEEQEWRLIDNRDPRAPDEARFRRGAFGITPYLVAPLPERWRGAPLGIAEVIVGPSSNAKAIVGSIQDLLKKKLKSSARVIFCGIPYRAW